MSRSDNNLLKLITDPDQEGELEQFTEEGIKLLIDFYNKLHPKLDKIHHIVATMIFDVHTEETTSHKERRMHKEAAEATRIAIESLRKTKAPPLKIFFTISVKENPESSDEILTKRHSLPLLLTDDKIIVLRDIDKRSEDILSHAIRDMGLRLIRPFIKHNTATGDDKATSSEKKISIQGDHKNCTGITAGILKDLQNFDAAAISTLEDGYLEYCDSKVGDIEIMPNYMRNLLAKLLKFSQSVGYVEATKLGTHPVKKDGTTLLKYVTDNKSITEGKVTTRISSKMDKMRQDMAGLDGDKESWAEKLLQLHEERKKAKEKSK